MPTDKDRNLHALILQKDDLAFARLCDELYEPVFKKLKGYYRDLAASDESLLMDVVTDSFINYFHHPERYHPEKQSLEKFLIMDAEGDLLNALDKIKRQNKNFQKAVELDPKNRKREIEDKEGTPYEALVNKESLELLERHLAEVFKEEKDVLLAQLLLSGERSSDEYAKLLDLMHLDEETRRQEVKRHKDRIDKVIKRKLRGKTDG